MRWRDKLGLLSDILEVFPHVSSALALIIALLSATAGITLSVFDLVPWAVAFIGLAIIGVIVYLIAKNKKRQLRILRNRHIVIDQDELDIRITKDGRFIERHVTLRALKLVEAYCFKFYWTGSSAENRVVCRDTDGYIAETIPLLENRFHWKPYELRFHEPLNADEIKTITLRYTMQDPEQMALPYHLFSYAHVQGCKKLVARVYFSDNIEPGAVYLYHRDEVDVVVLKRELLLDDKLQAYVINERPKKGLKYSIEWEWKGKKLIQQKQHFHTKDSGASIQYLNGEE